MTLLNIVSAGFSNLIIGIRMKVHIVIFFSIAIYWTMFQMKIVTRFEHAITVEKGIKKDFHKFLFFLIFNLVSFTSIKNIWQDIFRINSLIQFYDHRKIKSIPFLPWDFYAVCFKKLKYFY